MYRCYVYDRTGDDIRGFTRCIDAMSMTDDRTSDGIRGFTRCIDATSMVEQVTVSEGLQGVRCYVYDRTGDGIR